MMKKKYIAPTMETIQLKMTTVVAISTGFSEVEASSPAKGRLFDDEDDLELILQTPWGL